MASTWISNFFRGYCSWSVEICFGQVTNQKTYGIVKTRCREEQVICIQICRLNKLTFILHEYFIIYSFYFIGWFLQFCRCSYSAEKHASRYVSRLRKFWKKISPSFLCSNHYNKYPERNLQREELSLKFVFQNMETA